MTGEVLTATLIVRRVAPIVSREEIEVAGSTELLVSVIRPEP